MALPVLTDAEALVALAPTEPALAPPVEKKHTGNPMNCNNNNQVVTLGSLLAQDLPQAYILPERPSTFNRKARFVNDTKYIIHDYSSNISADHRYLKAMRACPVAGNELPVLLTRNVHPLMKEHWSKWLPFFPTPDIKIFDKEDTEEYPLIVNFPFEDFPAKKHAVHPDVHYKLSSKARIPEMGAPCPRYMSRDNYTFPCMIKSTQGVGGRGVYFVQSKDQANMAFHVLKTNFRCNDPVITEAVHDVTEIFNIQLYLFQNGDFHWLGVRRKMYSTQFVDLAKPDVNWNEQAELRKEVSGTTFPVMTYLHKNGYFGFIGVELLNNNKGKFLIDVNLKTSDSTYLLLLAPNLAALGYPVCQVIDILPISFEHLIEVIDKVNHEQRGRVVVMSGDKSSTGKPMKVCVAVFAENTELAFVLHQKLLNSCSSTKCVDLYEDKKNPTHG